MSNVNAAGVSDEAKERPRYEKWEVDRDGRDWLLVSQLVWNPRLGGYDIWREWEINEQKVCWVTRRALEVVIAFDGGSSLKFTVSATDDGRELYNTLSQMLVR